MNAVLVFVGVIFAVAGTGILVFGGVTLRQWRYVRTVEPISIRAATSKSGPVEVEGRIQSLDEPLVSPLLEKECVAYEYTIEERRRNRGQNDTPSESQWDTIDSGSARRPFFLEDDTGIAYVDPDGAALSLDTEQTSTIQETESLPSGLRSTVESGLSFDLGGIALSGKPRLRYTERSLDVGERGYIFGQTDSPPAGVDADIAITDGDETPLFLISDTGEQGTMRRLLLRGAGISAFGLLFFGLGLGLLVFGIA